MINDYLRLFLDQFVAAVVPHGKTLLIIEPSNKSRAFNKSRSYDYIICISILEEEKDIHTFFDALYIHLNPNGRLIIIYKNYVHAFIAGWYHSMIDRGGNKQNWLSTFDLKTFLNLANFETIVQQPLCFTTIQIPIVTKLLNFFLLYFFPLNHLAFLQYVVARKIPSLTKDASVSIIIPARNEAGNIHKIFERLPVLGTKTQIIFVEGHSRDNTRQEIVNCIKKYSSQLPVRFQLIDQKNGIGKAHAVQLGFSHASGDILMIYDADLSIKLGDLHKFYMALIGGKGEFINGSRLIYPMHGQAMQFLNILGNKFFSILYSWILGQKIKDTLCGTKALWRKAYLLMLKSNGIFGKYDPFGDFDLLLGASFLHLKIVDMPVRYYERTYGATNIKRFKHAWQLARYSMIAIKHLKFRSL